mmetsp:Transcript_19018/g.32539  ORF Transcript_19018/g.32539 Transcript_19018/m.32539 type:complete len:190 (+) Transcript_19018:1-570(+)|eukprot:CAMPEP_0119104472 /NCGR_PEP_ID=MMETSP1180-20130426/2672_1 /TAXON_ID=3052 ORGANISM="Chlamydomonas cf sp, Strain CCMP681" /NCGR_SAMPLE_ID=MMETSP1180 /ASSEMBLY_ACC=CAM_ASM_000741 /LENGTH=189 /DNA_ID=CAMNT_0007089239 /DNA_START=1 /DNA_END=570 /DNA_ORIENTATION=-
MAASGCMRLLLLVLAGLCVATSAQHVVRGKVLTPVLASTIVLLHTADGQLRQTSLDSEGMFTFSNVPSGNSLLQPFHVNYYFPEVRLEVGNKNGLQRASVLAQGPTGTVVHALQLPLLMKPAGELQYFEKRKAVDVLSFVKSPYGLMIVFSLFIIVVLPKMKMEDEPPADNAAIKAGPAGQPQRQVTNK